jgi:adenylate cyclase
VVVLPFNNFSGRASDDDTVDGLTEDLATSFVCVRNSAFTCKGKPADIKRVGEELGVR